MIEITTTQGIVLKGRSTRKVENHWFRGSDYMNSKKAQNCSTGVENRKGAEITK